MHAIVTTSDLAPVKELDFALLELEEIAQWAWLNRPVQNITTQRMDGRTQRGNRFEWIAGPFATDPKYHPRAMMEAGTNHAFVVFGKHRNADTGEINNWAVLLPGTLQTARLRHFTNLWPRATAHTNVLPPEQPARLL